MIYNLVDCNDPILTQPTEVFDFQNPPVDPLDLASNLSETMLKEGGIGLAANQCGMPYRVFVMYSNELIPCFNPKIVDSSQELICLEEGCLSYPGLFVKIKRPRKVRVRYTEPNGNTITRIFDGITARVFQHELSHLDGRSFIDDANFLEKERVKKQIKKLNRLKKRNIENK